MNSDNISAISLRNLLREARADQDVLLELDRSRTEHYDVSLVSVESLLKNLRRHGESENLELATLEALADSSPDAQLAVSVVDSPTGVRHLVVMDARIGRVLAVVSRAESPDGPEMSMEQLASLLELSTASRHKEALGMLKVSSQSGFRVHTVDGESFASITKIKFSIAEDRGRRVHGLDDFTEAISAGATRQFLAIYGQGSDIAYVLLDDNARVVSSILVAT